MTGPVRPLDPGPWKPCEPTVHEILAECRQVRLDLAAAVDRSRRARGADTAELGRAA